MMSEPVKKRNKVDETEPQPIPAVDSLDLQAMRRIFYQRLFPCEEMYDMLVNEDPKSFQCREIAYEIDAGGDSTYVRYNSYPDASKFRAALEKINPIKIDIGPVHSSTLGSRQIAARDAVKPVEKELVFDIDITDYDDVRHCCQGSDICQECWPLMAIAIKTIDRVLREDFGFSLITWVYSGRRGVHCWICDSRARKLTVEGRTAIAEYLKVERPKQTDNISFTKLPLKMPPALKQAYNTILLPIFENEVAPRQHLFEEKARWERVLTALPFELRGKLSEHMETLANGEERWAAFKSVVEGAMKSGKIHGSNPVVDVVFTFCYPRIDIEVSKQLHHLLKSPFCIHPGTQRVCVPIDPADCLNFNLSAVPTLRPLIIEINDYLNSSEGASDKKVKKLYKKTSLGPYMAFFKKSFLQPKRKAVMLEQAKKQEAEKKNSTTIDF